MPGPNATIYYQREGYDTKVSNLMGRQSAGEGFLRGFVRHSGAEFFHCLVQDKKQAMAFAEFVGGADTLGRPIHWACPDNMQSIAHTGCLFYPSPDIGRFAWTRRRLDQRLFSLCGVIHTICSKGAMDVLGKLMLSPVQEWDAVVCTSRPAADAVVNLLKGQAEFLAERLGAKNFTLPMLPIIPLGVDSSAYDFTDDYRLLWRGRFGLGHDDVAFLFFGRLSFHAKAHPLPMLEALEKLTALSEKRIVLLIAGRFANDYSAEAFREAVSAFCSGLEVVFVDGNDAEACRGAWAAADVFTSLADNFQESFGLTPIEAMAAGLPCVVSDWDGYKDTVRHGIDGFRVPTFMPPPPCGELLAMRYETEIDGDERFFGHAAQFVAVDVDCCLNAYHALVGNPDLRKCMGEEARRRARELFDWKNVIRLYQELWSELAGIRTNASESVPVRDGCSVNPTRPDPFGYFYSYPTAPLTGEDRFSIIPGATPERMKSIRNLKTVSFAECIQPEDQEIAFIFKMLNENESLSASRIWKEVAVDGRAGIFRALLWMYKLGLVKLSNSGDRMSGR